MTPEWGTSMDQLPTETQFLLLEHEDHGVYSIVLPLICGDFRATLKADRDRYDITGTPSHCFLCPTSYRMDKIR